MESINSIGNGLYEEPNQIVPNDDNANLDVTEIVDEITKDLPENMGPRKFADLLNERIEKVLPKDDESEENTMDIRNAVQKEIRFMFNKERFESVNEIIAKINPALINPAWFEKNARPFHRFVCKNFKTNDTNEVDWGFVAQKMGIENRFVYLEQKKGLSFEERVSEIVKTLEEKNPENFGPRWLRDNAHSEYRYLEKVLPKEGTSIVWDSVLELLPQEWSEKWQYHESKRGYSFEERVNEVLKILEEKNPRKFSPSWLIKNAPSEHLFFATNLKTDNGQVDWKTLINLLPEVWRDRWTFTEKRDLSGNNAIVELTSLVHDFKVEKFTPKWIEDHDPALYTALRSLLGRTKDNFIQWEKMEDLLPAEILSKFSFERSKTSGLSDVAERIRSRMKPGDLLSPTYFRISMPDMYKFFLRNMRTPEGNISWAFIMRTLYIDYGLPVDEIVSRPENGPTYKRIVERINDACERNNPTEISVEFLQAHDRTIQTQVRRYLQNEKSYANWSLVFKEVNEPYKSMWFEKEKKRNEINKQNVVHDLDILLTEINPESFSPEWIKSSSFQIYERIKRYFKNRYNEIDWEKLVKRMNPSWQKKWDSNAASLQKIESYHDQQEVDEITSKYSNDMYSIYMTGKAEMQKAEEIWSSLIALAQKGNIEAHETVSKMADKVISDYIATKDDPDSNAISVEIDEYEKLKIIERCINRYDATKEGFFRNYLLKSIGFIVKKKGFKYSLDREPEEGLSLYDRLSSNPDDDTEDYDDEF